MVQRFIPYGCQSINQDDVEAVSRALTGEIITRGFLVEEFERTVAEYCGAEYAVAFNSATSALEAALAAAEVNASDRVLTSPNTFVGSIAGAEKRGAATVFIDIDEESGNLNMEQLEASMNFRSTRGKEIILPVHYAGVPIDMACLDGLIANSRTVVIEDAAHALGSVYLTGEKVGSCKWSHMTVFSFHPAKTITTGEGGMVTTNHEEIYHKLKRFRNNGIERNPLYLEHHLTPWYYEVQEISGNYNFTDFQAALGLSQFRRLEKFIAKRQRLSACYRQLLRGAPHITPLKPAPEHNAAYHLFVVKIDFEKCGLSREKLMLDLKEQGIGTQVHYIPVYKHPYFVKKNGELSEYFPAMERYYSQALSLPLHCEMNEEDVEEICSILKKMLKN